MSEGLSNNLASLSIGDNVTNTTTTTKSPQVTTPPKKSPASAPTHGLTDDQIKKAASLLGLAQVKDCLAQLSVDGMNGNSISLVSNKENSDFVIVLVNGVELKDYQLVYGVPKLQKLDNQIAQNKGFQELKFKKYCLLNKWNGMNIQVFKYQDPVTGNYLVSAKPRATAFVLNDSKGITLTLVQSLLKQSPELIEPLLASGSKLNSMVFELCGSKVPHIVKYDFELALKPVFTISNKNEITPNLNAENIIIKESPLEHALLLQEMVEIKKDLYAKNKQFRSDNKLRENMFWFNHFAEEGRVLYLLNDDNTLVNNKFIYSVKPYDTEKNHWEQFDNELQSKILLIVFECLEKGLPINSETLMKEMDLDEFSWARHQNDIMDLAVLPPIAEPSSEPEKGKQNNKKGQQPPSTQEPKLKKKSKILITCGFPASGKSYFAQKLAESLDVSWKRINQDDLGTRKKCEDLFKQYLKSGDNIILDRCNQDILQRRNWVKLARQGGVGEIHLLWFKIDQQICKDRIVVRENHPTIPKGQEGIQIIDKFQAMFTEPSSIEGFTSITLIQSEADSNELIVKYTTPLVDESVPDTTNANTTTTTSTTTTEI